MVNEDALSTARLLLAPATRLAFLSYQAKLYLASSAATMSHLLSYVPLTLVDGRGDKNPMKVAQGMVDVTFADETSAILRLIADDSVETVELRVDQLSGPYADWVHGAYHDRWIATEAEIEVVGASNVVFELYLPPLEDPGKIVKFEWDGGSLSVDVARDQVTSHAPIRLDAGRHRIRISSGGAEDHSNSSDSRFLGVLVGSVILDQKPITPWRHERVFPLGARRNLRAA